MVLLFANKILPIAKCIFKTTFYLPLKVTVIMWHVENLNNIHHQKQLLKSVLFHISLYPVIEVRSF